jgi:hypothetical protein
MIKLIIISLILVGSKFLYAQSEHELSTVSNKPLLKAHAHNDYLHKNPLFDALENGFTSIEVDIHFVNGKLYVAHEEEKIVDGLTLQSVYLNPLYKIIEKNNGYVYNHDIPLILFIDIKTDADSTYTALKKVFKKYSEIFTYYKDDDINMGAIFVIISGNRPKELLNKSQFRYAGYDGRLDDLGSIHTNLMIPMISENWKKYFKWDGKAEMPTREYERLTNIIIQAHNENRKVRFWATDVDSSTDQIKIWKKLLDADVDLINTDKLVEFRNYFRKYENGVNKK